MEIDLHAIKSVIRPWASILLSTWSNPPNSRWGAAGIDGEGNGEKVGPIPLPSQLRTLGERHEFPQRVPGRSPGKKRIWCILSVTEPFWLQDIVNILKNAK